MEALEYIRETARESEVARAAFVQEHGGDLVATAKAVAEVVDRGGKILICGNGGSAADAQHWAAEMVGVMLVKDRRPLPAIALTTDTSNLTAIGNDFSYDEVFLKQVQALAKKEDLFFAISTSGNSRNVLLAAEEARRIGARVVSLTGGSGGKLKAVSDICLCVSEGKNSSRIQETHIFAYHSIVDLVDRYFVS